MSHVATIDIEIKDLAALQAACTEIGMEFHEGQKEFKWYGRWVGDYNGRDAAFNSGIDPKDYGKCTHALSVPGNKNAYEIGVIAQKDGSFKLAWDFFAGGYGLQKVVGEKCGKLVQSYAKHAAMNALAKQGYAFAGTKKLDNGTVEHVFTHA